MGPAIIARGTFAPVENHIQERYVISILSSTAKMSQSSPQNKRKIKKILDFN
jgi:hypothetical protein